VFKSDKSRIDMTDKNNHKYSISLPTYNEKDNLPLIIWMIDQSLTQAYLFRHPSLILFDNPPMLLVI
jgi:hypothetical protein